MTKAIVMRSVDPHWSKWAAVCACHPSRWYDTEKEASEAADYHNLVTIPQELEQNEWGTLTQVIRQMKPVKI